MNVGEAYPNIGLGPDDEIWIAIVVEKDGDSFYAYTPGLKGLHVEGATEEEACARAKECATVYLESLNKHQESLAEGPGLMILRKRKARRVYMQWHSIDQPGISLKTSLQPT